MNQDEQAYMGDGVYARRDKFGVTLTTNNGVKVTNEIYLDAEVLEALMIYCKRGKKDDSNKG